MENCKSVDSASVNIVRNGINTESIHAKGIYTIECVDENGNVKWTDTAHNLVVDQGKNAMLNIFFAGTAYTGSFVCSLITAGTAIPTSTYAAPTVTEVASNVISSRVAVTWNGATTGTVSSTTISFPILAASSITGNMIVSGGTGVMTVGDTTAQGGILFSAAAFASGSKTVGIGDTLNVVYSIAV